MFRKVREEDLGQLVAIENATQDVPWTDNIFKECLHIGYPTWVIEHENKVVGFSIIAMHGDECHLLNLCIHPRYQRQGFGQQLLAYVIDRVKHLGAMMIYLEVRESNFYAMKLYERFGFKQMGVRKDYYPAVDGREDAYVFARDLGEEKSI